MKQVCLMILVMLFASPVFAQKKNVRESDVPEAVKKTFSEKYKGTSSRSWKTKNGDYEVDFFIGSKKYEAKFEADGRWKKTSFDIKTKEVPEVVINAWKQTEFGKWFLDDTEQVETPDHKALYLVKVTKGTSVMELLFTPAGELMKTKDKN